MLQLLCHLAQPRMGTEFGLGAELACCALQPRSLQTVDLRTSHLRAVYVCVRMCVCVCVCVCICMFVRVCACVCAIVLAEILNFPFVAVLLPQWKGGKCMCGKCMYVYINIRIYTISSACIDIYIYMYTCIHFYLSMNVTYICIYIYVFICTHKFFSS